MKKLISLLLCAVMLFGGCVSGANIPNTPDKDPTDGTQTPAGDPPITAEPDTDAPTVTDPPDPVERIDYTIDVSEDSYVLNKDATGDTSNKNFGDDVEIHVKNSGGNLTRYGYFKFDVSSLVGDNDFTCIDFDIQLSIRQTSADTPMSIIKVYGVSTDWAEDEICYSAMPEEYGFITSKEVGKEKEVNSFSITDYVRQAVAAGKKEIALVIKEASEPTALHTRFHSKESGVFVPRLSVYYGTKEDNTVYDGLTDIPAPEVSKTGLDSILGQSDISTQRVKVLEDTHVEAGASVDKNFGNAEIIDVKANNAAGTASTHRIALFKFDISKLREDNIFNVLFTFNVNEMEAEASNRDLVLYGCDPFAWEENVVTYNTVCDHEDIINSISTARPGKKSIDVTEYVKNAYENGEKYISFYLTGDSGTFYRTRIDSSEKSGGFIPCLEVTYGKTAFSTSLRYEGENPWDVAMTAVTTWLDRWEKIKEQGASNAELVVKDLSEYSVTVDVASAAKTNGADTKYSPYQTRLINTLNGFKPNKNETDLYDEYGGYKGGEKYAATGFFYTKKIGDRWWTIDPLGYPYYRTAVVQVAHGSSPNQKELTLAKFGSLNSWAESATERLYELGFNSAGGWSEIDVLSKIDNPLSQTTIFNTAVRYGNSIGVSVNSGGGAMDIDIIPVFDPGFAKFADEQIRDIVTPYANDPHVYGWMSDNELSQNRNMLDHSLSLDVNDTRRHYSYATAWTFMYLKTGKADVSLSDVTDELRMEFLAMTYDRYFEVITTALNKYDPNHLYMGCRFLASNFGREMIMRVAGYWCDIVTANYYGVWEGSPTLMKNVQNWMGDKPFVVTEWYAKGMDVWEKNPLIVNKTGAGWTVRTQADRGKFYQNYALMLMECKGCVGFDWFKYWDNDPTHEGADPSNRDSNKGMYSNEGEEYTALSDYMEELNTQKYTLIDFFDER